MQNDSYNLSFTVADVLRVESVRLARLHEDLGDWDAVRVQAVADRHLQVRKAAEAVRVCRELLFRLQGLSVLRERFLSGGSAPRQARPQLIRGGP